ncbi:LysR family transcriptional regulator [Paraburkholderia sp. BR10937]|uniref:LysR family transcriptional regulator n=1 Tax=Paraburkholderia sp. BR10937 TaxID=3236994 RepID=UPI0034D3448D
MWRVPTESDTGDKAGENRELNFQRPRYFYEGLVHGSIRGTAESLNTAPSVIARHVKLLEDELGTNSARERRNGSEA